MKTKIRLKILKWVCKLLRYDSTKDIPLRIEVEYARVKLVKSSHMYSNRELLMIGDDQLKYAHQLSLMSELEKIGAIEYSKLYDEMRAHTTSYAELLIILPKK